VEILKSKKTEIIYLLNYTDKMESKSIRLKEYKPLYFKSRSFNDEFDITTLEPIGSDGFGLAYKAKGKEINKFLVFKVIPCVKGIEGIAHTDSLLTESLSEVFKMSC
jgi:hypothetical protein